MGKSYYETSYWPYIKEFIDNPTGKDFPFARCSVCIIDPSQQCHPGALRINGYDSFEHLGLKFFLNSHQSLPCGHLVDDDLEEAILLPCGHIVGDKCFIRECVAPTIQDGSEPAEERIGAVSCPLCAYKVVRDKRLCRHRLEFKALDNAGEIPFTIPEGGTISKVCINCDWQNTMGRYAAQVNNMRLASWKQHLSPEEIIRLPGFISVCRRFLMKITNNGSRLWTSTPSAVELVARLDHKIRMVVRESSDFAQNTTEEGYASGQSSESEATPSRSYVRESLIRLTPRRPSVMPAPLFLDSASDKDTVPRPGLSFS